ncbi:MAG: hypothetical protein H7096_08100 [Flavobacterium sp.]|nr:hypothetical protein [Pedobacter sp.]
MIVSKQCLDCDKELRGRSDKKFCDDQCRSNFNNRQQSENTLFMREVNSILKKNRRIMDALNPAGKIKVSRKILLNKGFNFDYYTNIYKTQTGKTYFFCYETGYLPIENDEILLIRKQ